MEKQDLTTYSDNELSMTVYNVECLYRDRFRTGFIDLLHELFVVTDAQIEVLKDDINEELEGEE